MNNEYEIRGYVTAIFLKCRDGSVIETVIDTADLEKVNGFSSTWYAYRRPRNRTMYVLASGPVWMHRFILDAPKGFVVDHANHNGLDNRRENIKVVTQSENMLNRDGPRKGSKSGVRGVSWCSRTNNWMAELHGKFVGRFDTVEEAAEAIRLKRG